MLIAPALSNEMTLTNIDCLMQFTTAAAKLAGEVVSFLERGGPVIAAPRSQPDRLPEGLAVVVEPDNDADWLAALASDVPGRSSIGVTELARRNGGTLVRSGSKRLTEGAIGDHWRAGIRRIERCGSMFSTSRRPT